MAGYRYEKADKVYHVKKKRLNVKKMVLLLVIPSIILMAFGALCIFSSLQKDNKAVLSYNEKGNIDYKVYLKENNYYEDKFLGKNMQYIASLINTINVDFKYEMHSTDNVNYNYKYKIVGTLKITDKTDDKKVLYSKDEVLLNETTKKVSDNNFIINEDIDIDYDKYNNYANSFRRDYGLTSNAYLELNMIISVDGDYDKTTEKIASNNNLKIRIPLSEQTVDIGMTASDINNSKALAYTEKIEIGNIILLISGTLLSILGLSGIIIAICVYLSRYSNDPYENALYKILKNYDTYIVKAKSDFRESENLIRVETFEELIDAQKIEQTPILFYEVEPGNKAYFVLNGSKTTYRFTLTRAYQERLTLTHKKGEF